MRSANTAVVGVGPVGGILAAHLLRSGMDVALIDTDEAHLRCMQREGLVLEGAESFTAPVNRCYLSLRDAADAGEHFGLIYVCVKTSVIHQVAGELSRVLAERGGVVGLHNGIDTEAPLMRAVGEKRVVRGVINYAGNRIEAGRIRMTFFNPPNYVGSVVPGEVESEKLAAEVATQLAGMGLQTEFSKEIRRYVWEKVIRNVVLAPVSAITGLDMAEVMGSPHGRDLVERLLEEAIAVAARAGYGFGDDFYNVTLQYLEKAGHHRPSMLCDVLEKKRTEIAYQNQKIVEYGEELGVPTPCNKVITNLVQSIDDRLAQ